jgi:hypothetical protein
MFRDLFKNLEAVIIVGACVFVTVSLLIPSAMFVADSI